MPVYNEFSLFETVLKKLLCFEPINSIEKEIIIIDDGSSDGTKGLIKSASSKNLIKIFNKKNFGKGFSIRAGIKKMTGDYMIIHDSDLEYDTAEINKLISIACDKKADVVYGSRFLSGDSRRVLYFWHTLGNKFLTILSNFFSNLNFTDIETCYKLINKKTIEKLNLKENRFGIEPELTAKIGKLNKKNNLKIYETGISYNGRTYSEGKKINWKDGFSALRCIIKYSF